VLIEFFMARKTDNTSESFDGWQLFEAEAQYAESIFRNALGDIEASIAAAQRALEIKPDYAPAILTMGSIEYQRGKRPREDVCSVLCFRCRTNLGIFGK
jgi:tetratricopeptide (TPR) repeat protein